MKTIEFAVRNIEFKYQEYILECDFRERSWFIDKNIK